MSVETAIKPDSNTDPIDRLIAEHRPGFALARPFYMDRAVFERDMERIFRRHWHCVGHASQIANPGDYMRVEFEQEAVLVVRDRDGAINAFLNVCRHRGAELCAEKEGNAKAFVCPYHAWTYRLDGSLRAARLMPKGFDVVAYSLKRVACRQSCGLLFISFAQTPLDFDPVHEILEGACGQYGWGEARVAHRQTYPINANWKLAVENYVECYHCGPAHPEYSQTHALQQPPERIAELNEAMERRTRALGVTVGSADRWQDSSRGQEAIHAFRYALYDGVSTGSQDGSPIAPLMGGFTKYDGGVTSIHVGGSTFLVCYPDHGLIYRFVPKDERSCEMELIWLVRGDAKEGADYDPARLAWLWTVTSEEDKRIIEHASKGVRSHYYEPGPLAPMEYNELRYLRWYLSEIARPAL
jgi:phenylpropionate dioxygenase-like ring-hydroxylating dioxygenase large terminal subunit